MVEKINSLRVLMEKPNRRRQLGRPKQRLDNRIKIYLKIIGLKVVG